MLCPKCKAKIKTRLFFKDRKRTKGNKYYIECPNCGAKFMQNLTKVAALVSCLITIAFVIVIISPMTLGKRALVLVTLMIVGAIWVKIEERKTPLVEFNEGAFNKLSCDRCGKEIYFDNSHRVAESGGVSYWCNTCYNKNRRFVRILFTAFILLLIFTLYYCLVLRK